MVMMVIMVILLACYAYRSVGMWCMLALRTDTACKDRRILSSSQMAAIKLMII